MKTDRNSHLHLTSVKLSAVLCSLAVLFGLLFGPLFGMLSWAASEARAQGVRRPAKAQQRIQKKIEKQGGSKLASPGETEPAATKPTEPGVKQDVAPSQPQNNLAGIRERGILSLFSREEAQLVIPGFGRPPALLIVFRQLNLTPEQKEQIRAIRLRVGNRAALAPC